MIARNHRKSGLLGMEIAIALGVALLIATTVALVALQYRVARQESELQRSLTLAAAEQLAQVRAGLIDSATLPSTATAANAPTPSKAISVVLTAERGAGDWVGLMRITAHASRRVGPRRVASVTLTTYVADPQPTTETP